MAHEGGTLKLGCCSWSYHRALAARRITFAEWLRVCAEELQVGGVDIIAEQVPTRTRGALIELKKRCADTGLTIVSWSPGNDFGKPAAAQRRGQVAYVLRTIDEAVLLGAPIVRIFAGWPGAGRQQALWPAMVACMRQAARAAARAGVTLAVEPHNGGGFLPDSRATLKLIREVASPWLRINLDTGNYHEPDVYAGFEASLPYAPHVVAKINKPDAGGNDTLVDHDRVFAMLKRRGYHGFVTLEYEGKADELTMVPKAIAALRRLGRAHRL